MLWQAEGGPRVPHAVLQVVTAVQDLRIVSVFDGKTQYRLGHTTRAARGAMSWPPTDAVLYCYQSAERALNAQFPKKVAVEKGPLVRRRARATGGFGAGGALMPPHAAMPCSS